MLVTEVASNKVRCSEAKKGSSTCTAAEYATFAIGLYKLLASQASVHVCEDDYEKYAEIWEHSQPKLIINRVWIPSLLANPFVE